MASGVLTANASSARDGAKVAATGLSRGPRPVFYATDARIPQNINVPAWTIVSVPPTAQRHSIVLLQRRAVEWDSPYNAILPHHLHCVFDPIGLVVFLQFIHDLDSVFASSPIIEQEYSSSK
jgi:hypothetical protein